MGKKSKKGSGKNDECVKVIVRVRPLNEKEKNNQSTFILEILKQRAEITIKNPNAHSQNAKKSFTYDAVFSPAESQELLYEETAFSLVESVAQGFNGTIFAYGQTGCGKTYTMMGPNPKDKVDAGIIPRSFKHIFNIQESETDKKFLIRCTYIEIYNNQIRDLLGKNQDQRMAIKEHKDKGIFIKDVTYVVAKGINGLLKAMDQGNKNRHTGATAMNAASSRSHSIFTLYIETSETKEGQELFKAGKLNLVDLAGSERQSKTQAQGVRLQEAQQINLSLSALGNVISALVNPKSRHIPYRDSKLTRLLQDSLGGNTKTIMIANCSPASFNYDETLGTLRYANRAKQIKNSPKINEDPKDALLRQYSDEIQRLKEMLMNQGGMPQQMNDQQMSQSKVNQINVEFQQNGGSSKMFRKMGTMERIQLQGVLRGKDQAYQQAQQQNDALQQKLKELQSRIGGVQVQGEQPKQKQGMTEEEKQRFQLMRKKVKKQQMAQRKLIQQRKEKEVELSQVKRNYSSLQEEVEDMRELLEKIKVKYKQAMVEIEDLQHEHQFDKQNLINTIRNNELELKMYKAITKMLLAPDELMAIRMKAKWKDEQNDYKIPPFILKNKRVEFPKLNHKQGMQLVEKEKKNRELEFQRNGNGQANRQYYNQQNNNHLPKLKQKQAKRGQQNFRQKRKHKKFNDYEAYDQSPKQRQLKQYKKKDMQFDDYQQYDTTPQHQRQLKQYKKDSYQQNNPINLNYNQIQYNANLRFPSPYDDQRLFERTNQDRDIYNPRQQGKRSRRNSRRTRNYSNIQSQPNMMELSFKATINMNSGQLEQINPGVMVRQSSGLQLPQIKTKQKLPTLRR